MSFQRKPEPRQLAVTVSFTALYVVFGAIKISPIIGLPGQAITAAAILAPIMGILFGPYISTLSTVLGGIIGFSLGYFSPLSLASGAVAAMCGGMTSKGKKSASIAMYLLLLLLLTFFPNIGPAWLYPPYSWFQTIVFIILISPLQAAAIKYFDSKSNSKLLYAFFITSLTSTLAGQIAGSVTFEVLISSNINTATSTWVTTAFLYPIERIIIAVASAMIGTALFRVLKTTNLMPFLNPSNRQEKCS
jgi:membrane protein YqaA with SNARE-associated domain